MTGWLTKRSMVSVTPSSWSLAERGQTSAEAEVEHGHAHREGLGNRPPDQIGESHERAGVAVVAARSAVAGLGLADGHPVHVQSGVDEDHPVGHHHGLHQLGNELGDGSDCDRRESEGVDPFGHGSADSVVAAQVASDADNEDAQVSHERWCRSLCLEHRAW